MTIALKRNVLQVLFAVALGVLSVTSSAQIGGLGGLGDKLKKKTPNLLGEKEPITTSLPDAKWGDPSQDGFTPREPQRSLMTLQRTPNGGFVLQPGYYSMQVQSYCLHAGTHGPGGGNDRPFIVHRCDLRRPIRDIPDAHSLHRAVG